MTYARFKQELHRFFNSFVIIALCVFFILFGIVIYIGLLVHTVHIPSFLGNRPEVIKNVKINADPNELIFVVVGDIKCGTSTFEELLNIISEDKPAFGVILGDFVEHQLLISHKLFVLEMAEHMNNFPIFLVPGNHDIDPNAPFKLEDFEKMYGPSQFYFTVGKNLFVFLNNIPPYSQTGQYLEFLEQAILSQTEKVQNIFVFMHVPVSGINSSLMSRGLPESEKLLEIAKKYHINYFFSGDHHGYVKTEKDGTTFIISGGGGDRLRGTHGRFHHLVRISVKDGVVTETVVAIKKQLETMELIERNIVVYIWPLITRSVLSIIVTIAIFGITVWALIYSLLRKKQLKILKD